MRFIKKTWPALAVLGCAVAICLWFATGVLRDVVYFNDPQHQDEALKPWMTPRYVMMSYDLPRAVVAEVLEIPEVGQRRQRLDVVAERMGLSLEELTERVRAAADAHREGDI